MFIVSVLYMSGAQEQLKLNYFSPLESVVLQCHDKGHWQVIMDKTASGYQSTVSKTCLFSSLLQKQIVKMFS